MLNSFFILCINFDTEFMNLRIWAWCRIFYVWNGMGIMINRWCGHSGKTQNANYYIVKYKLTRNIFLINLCFECVSGTYHGWFNSNIDLMVENVTLIMIKSQITSIIVFIFHSDMIWYNWYCIRLNSIKCPLHLYFDL